MASNEHVIPPDLLPLSPMQIGMERATATSIGDLGGASAVSWETRNRRTYGWTPSVFDSSNDYIEQWEAFLHDIKLGALPFWVPEQIADTHRHVYCGPPGDASRVSFPVSVMSPTGVTVFNNGAVVNSSTYTVYAAANKLTNNQANAVDATTGMVALGSGSIARDTGVSCTGLTSFKVTPDAPSITDFGILQGSATYFAATGGSTRYCAGASVLGAGTFQVGIYWFDGSKVFSKFDYTEITGSATAWTTTSKSAVSPAGATPPAGEYASVAVIRTTASADPFYVGSLWLANGDYDRYHLPTAAPGLVRFTSGTPAAGARITATATGKKISRCWMNRSGSSQWQLRAPGHALARTIQMTERAEFAW